MLLLIQCKYRILEKYRPPLKRSDEMTGETSLNFDNIESEALMNGENKTTLDMEIQPKVCGLKLFNRIYLFYC